jgi:hypothetical protein
VSWTNLDSGAVDTNGPRLAVAIEAFARARAIPRQLAQSGVVMAAGPAPRLLVVVRSDSPGCMPTVTRDAASPTAVTPTARALVRVERALATLQSIPQSVLARVHGLATAAGCHLVATVDLGLPRAHRSPARRRP